MYLLHLNSISTFSVIQIERRAGPNSERNCITTSLYMCYIKSLPTRFAIGNLYAVQPETATQYETLQHHDLYGIEMNIESCPLLETTVKILHEVGKKCIFVRFGYLRIGGESFECQNFDPSPRDKSLFHIPRSNQNVFHALHMFFVLGIDIIQVSAKSRVCLLMYFAEIG